MTRRQCPFRYFGYWDFPRLVAVRDGDRVILLRSSFNDELDDFEAFEVFEMAASVAPGFTDSLRWADFDLSKARFLGTVPATKDIFDETRHEYVKMDLIDATLAVNQEPSG